MLGTGCTPDRKRGAYVARVDNAVLTQEELARSRDSSGEVQAFSKEYVNDWIVRELLFQEAERRGITETEEFQRQSHQAVERLAVAALLQREVYAALDTASVSEEEIRAYYASSSGRFALRQDVVLASTAVFDSRDAANTFRSRVLRGTPWTAALEQMTKDSVQRSHLLRVAHRQYFTHTTLFPEELWKLARSLQREDVSFPLKTPDGTFVLRVHTNFHQGEIPPLEYVRQEVRQHVLMNLRRRKYDSLVATLKEKRRIDVHLERLDSATAKAPN